MAITTGWIPKAAGTASGTTQTFEDGVQASKVIQSDSGTALAATQAGTAQTSVLCSGTAVYAGNADKLDGADSTAFPKLATSNTFTADNMTTPGTVYLSSGSVTWDWAIAQNGTLPTLSANITAWTLQNVSDGKFARLRLSNAGTFTAAFSTSALKGMTGYTMSSGTKADSLMFCGISGTSAELVGYRQGIEG
jgi:hypothetical protein